MIQRFVVSTDDFEIRFYVFVNTVVREVDMPNSVEVTTKSGVD